MNFALTFSHAFFENAEVDTVCTFPASIVCPDEWVDRRANHLFYVVYMGGGGGMINRCDSTRTTARNLA